MHDFNSVFSPQINQLLEDWTYPIDKTALEKGLFFLYNYRGFLTKKDDVKIVGFLSLKLLHKNPKARIGI